MSNLRLHRNKSAWTYPATLVKYTRNAVPDSMMGSYTVHDAHQPYSPGYAHTQSPGQGLTFPTTTPERTKKR